ESAANAISVKAGDGSDIIDVGKFGTGAVSAIQAPVTVDGEAGTDAVRVNDPMGILGNYTVTAAQVTTTSGLGLSYAGAESRTVTAGQGNAMFNVQGTAAGMRTTLNGGSGSDLFQVGNAALTLDDIQGSLILNGGSQLAFGTGDTVNLLDQGSV